MTPQHPSSSSAAQPAVGGILKRLAELLAAIGTLWIFFLMFLIVADVAGRNFLDRPITGVAEFAAHSVVAIVFLQLTAGITSGRMTRSDSLLQLIWRRVPAVGRGLEVLYALVGAVVFAVLAYVAWPELMTAWRGNEFFGVRGVYMVPTWPFRGLLVVGSALAALVYLLMAFALVGGAKPVEGGGHE